MATGVEDGVTLCPRYNEAGLITAVAVNVNTREVLMLAFMNAEAFTLTCKTGRAHFYSRSRKQLWLKGETSGNYLNVEEIRIDCDQDAVLLLVRPEGPACHTGARSCFYRRVVNGNRLERIDESA